MNAQYKVIRTRSIKAIVKAAQEVQNHEDLSVRISIEDGFLGPLLFTQTFKMKNLLDNLKNQKVGGEDDVRIQDFLGKGYSITVMACM